MGGAGPDSGHLFARPCGGDTAQCVLGLRGPRCFRGVVAASVRAVSLTGAASAALYLKCPSAFKRVG